jgi:hypothetical protein
MTALHSRDDFEAAERRQRLRAMRGARYRSNLARIGLTERVFARFSRKLRRFLRESTP